METNSDQPSSSEEPIAPAEEPPQPEEPASNFEEPTKSASISNSAEPTKSASISEPKPSPSFNCRKASMGPAFPCESTGPVFFLNAYIPVVAAPQGGTKGTVLPIQLPSICKRPSCPKVKRNSGTNIPECCRMPPSPRRSSTQSVCPPCSLLYGDKTKRPRRPPPPKPSCNCAEREDPGRPPPPKPSCNCAEREDPGRPPPPKPSCNCAEREDPGCPPPPKPSCNCAEREDPGCPPPPKPSCNCAEREDPTADLEMLLDEITELSERLGRPNAPPRRIVCPAQGSNSQQKVRAEVPYTWTEETLEEEEVHFCPPCAEGYM